MGEGGREREEGRGRMGEGEWEREEGRGRKGEGGREREEGRGCEDVSGIDVDHLAPSRYEHARDLLEQRKTYLQKILSVHFPRPIAPASPQPSHLLKVLEQCSVIRLLPRIGHCDPLAKYYHVL